MRSSDVARGWVQLLTPSLPVPEFSREHRLWIRQSMRVKRTRVPDTVEEVTTLP